MAFSVLVVVAALLMERWRGQWALNRWKQQMAAEGEIFEPDKMWPRPTARSLAVSNELRLAVEQLPPGLSRFSGQICAIVVKESGMARRGSQEPSPVLASQTTESNTWLELELEIRHAEPSLELLRKILRDPPADMGYEILSGLDKLSIPNFVNVRRAAQALQAAALSDLHRTNLAGAKDNLFALAGFTRLHAEDPSLVNYMIRIAILRLSTEVAWDALQADGWTDAQLAELQQAFQCDKLLAQMQRTIAAERSGRLYELQWFSSHSYLAWVTRYQSFYESLGYKVPVSAQVYAIRYWRDWLFHPLWRFAWADQEKLQHLQHYQAELEAIRAAVQTGSGTELNRRFGSLQNNYQLLAASWRFYIAVPLIDQMSEKVGASILNHQYPYADFRRAWSTSMKNLTLCHMLTTAIGLKRYELRHGKPSVSLEALVPDFVAEVPHDLMDGQPLRYKLRSDGTYCLYSVGEDAQDDQGSPLSETNDRPPSSAWDARDWVWPQVVPVHADPGA